jgi:uncharacterized membrane protein YhdT
MTTTTVNSTFFNLQNAKTTLNAGIKSWFVIALIGQWAFAFYIFAIYTLSMMYGLSVTDFSPAPSLKKGDNTIQTVFFAHTIPAIYLGLFGLFQLVPKLRNRYKGFHRWNGRIFLVLGMTGALSGLFLQWSKGAETNTAASLGITLNGILILIAGYFTYRFAVQKRFDMHERLAVHTFILVNGVWTFRLYLMGWYIVNQGPNGNTKHVDGPMDIFFSFACYLLPMLIAELYFWAKKQKSNGKTWGASIAIIFGALISLIGVGSAILAMWTPRITKVMAAIG